MIIFYHHHQITYLQQYYFAHLSSDKNINDANHKPILEVDAVPSIFVSANKPKLNRNLPTLKKKSSFFMYHLIQKMRKCGKEVPSISNKSTNNVQSINFATIYDATAITNDMVDFTSELSSSSASSLLNPTGSLSSIHHLPRKKLRKKIKIMQQKLRSKEKKISSLNDTMNHLR